MTADTRIDLALPADMPLVELHTDLLQLSGLTQRRHAAVGFRLTRPLGSPLDPCLSLAAQGVRDGDVLCLGPLADQPAPPLYDDVADCVRDTLTATGGPAPWTPSALRATALATTTVFAALAAAVPWLATPQTPHPAWPPAALATALFIAAAGVRARIYRDPAAGAVLGAGALPNAFTAGFALAATHLGDHPVRLDFLTGCATTLLTAVVLTALLPRHRALPIAAAGASACGLSATFVLTCTDHPPVDAAAASAAVALVTLACAPSWSARAARLPVGFWPPDAPEGARRAGDSPVDHHRVAERARRAHDVLTGVVGACAVSASVACGVLAVVGDVWARLLAAVVVLVLPGRARMLWHRSQVVTLWGAAVTGAVLLLCAVAAHSDSVSTHRSVGVSMVAFAVAALAAAMAFTVPDHGVSPFWGRCVDAAETLLLAAVFPLLLAVLHAYTALRDAA